MDFDSPLLKLVRQTKRYSICEHQPNRFEVIDNRYMLDHLLRVPELRPPTGDITQSEFEELLDSLSAGPSLTEEDDAMLGWLMMTVEALDPNGTNTALNSVYACAVLFNGTLDEVEYIIRAVLNHRVT